MRLCSLDSSIFGRPDQSNKIRRSLWHKNGFPLTYSHLLLKRVCFSNWMHHACGQGEPPLKNVSCIINKQRFECTWKIPWLAIFGWLVIERAGTNQNCFLHVVVFQIVKERLFLEGRALFDKYFTLFLISFFCSFFVSLIQNAYSLKGNIYLVVKFKTVGLSSQLFERSSYLLAIKITA